MFPFIEGVSNEDCMQVRYARCVCDAARQTMQVCGETEIMNIVHIEYLIGVA